MEILEHGNSYRSMKCEECSCKFQYTRKDIKTATWSEDYYKYVKCPECEHIIRLANWEE